MHKILDLESIKTLIAGKKDRIVAAVEQGFVAYSEGKCVIPPVGELSFYNPPGDAHIKYGYLKNDDYYVIKIASIFYENKNLGLRPNNGMMLLFSQRTGEPLCILLDDGYLTQVRTAAAGAVVAKHLAPEHISNIGIFGVGIQGMMQVEYLKTVTSCQNVIAWGVNKEELENYKRIMTDKGFHITTTLKPKVVADNCNLIITATPAKEPFFKKEFLKKGMHVTAVGSDTPEKQEVESEVLHLADIVVADSLAQSRLRGEIHHALESNAIAIEDLVELGQLVSEKNLQRTSDEQVTFADLTGVAVQDLQISKLVYESSLSG